MTIEEAEAHCIAGLSVWRKYSTEDGVNPDVVLVGIGVAVTMEITPVTIVKVVKWLRYSGQDMSIKLFADKVIIPGTSCAGENTKF